MATLTDIQRRMQEHYNSNPCDNFTDETLTRIGRSLLGRSLERLSRADQLQIDVGCGTGKEFALIEKYGRGGLLGVDLTVESLRRLRSRWPAVPLINASNLALPLRDGVARLVLSEGVIHHTPDARVSFGECARLVAAGGHLFVAVYNAHNRYRRVYEGIGALFRWIGRRPAGPWILRHLLIPLWYVYYCIFRSLLTRGAVSQVTLERSVNLFYDRYMVPRATFHTVAELTVWGRECGLDVVECAERGSMIEMLFYRPTHGES